MWANSRTRGTKPLGPFWSSLTIPDLYLRAYQPIYQDGWGGAVHILLAYFLLKHLLCFPGSVNVAILPQMWNKVPSRCMESLLGSFSILICCMGCLTSVRLPFLKGLTLCHIYITRLMSKEEPASALIPCSPFLSSNENMLQKTLSLKKN